MAVKDEVMRLLEEKRGKFLSGEMLALSLGVSRAAVWKAVRLLKEDGYDVIAVTNRGYRLSGEDDVLSTAEINRHYIGEIPINISLYKSVDSTNTLALQKASNGASEGTVVITGAQTAGKGRLGRSFFSPEDTGLYMSVVLRPKISTGKAVMLTAAASVAVVEAIEILSGRQAVIKWVNDVFVEGRKVCGILTEASFGMELGTLEYAVLGIGVNVYEPNGGFPPEISGIAGSVFANREHGLRNKLAAEILNRFIYYYKRLSDGGFVNVYRKKSAVIGKRITVIRGGTSETAEALGIDGSCRLQVRYSDGSEEFLSSGEISVKIL